MSSDEGSSQNIIKDESSNQNIARSRFSAEEDAKLVQLQQQQLDWNEISRQIGNRSPRQCRERYQNYLDPELNKSTWTQDEDNLLLKKESEMGKKWKKMMPYFQNRSNVNIKNRFTTLQNRIKANERQQAKGFFLPSMSNMNSMNSLALRNMKIQKMMNWEAQSQKYQQMKLSMQSNQSNIQAALYDQHQEQISMPKTCNSVPNASSFDQTSYFNSDYSRNNSKFNQSNGIFYGNQIDQLDQREFDSDDGNKRNEQIYQLQMEQQNYNQKDQIQMTNMMRQNPQVAPPNFDQNENDKIVNEVFDDDQEIQMMWNFLDGDIDQKNNFF